MTDMLTILHGDALANLRELPDASVQCCVTSPPYFGLRDYGNPAQIGLEPTPAEYVAKLVAVFGEVRRVLRDAGIVFLNLGDSYASGGEQASGFTESRHQFTTNSPPPPQGRAPITPGFKQKDMIGIPWRVAFALHAEGWYLRQDIIWAKPNPMPESVTDRCTKSHEYIFLFSKSARYYFDAEAIAEQCEPESWHNSDFRRDRNFEIHPTTGVCERNARGQTRNKRDVWTVPSAPYAEAHFATFPPALITPCILAGTKAGDTVLDPFFGSGTTGMVALGLGRKCIGIELNADYIALARQRCETTVGLAL